MSGPNGHMGNIQRVRGSAITQQQITGGVCQRQSRRTDDDRAD